MDRERRERRIRSRLDVMLEQRWLSMLEQRWLSEVQGLLDRPLSPDAPAWRALGYSELAAHLRGELGLAEAKEAIIIRTRQYAKPGMERLDPRELHRNQAGHQPPPHECRSGDEWAESSRR
ncbi:MAG: hypothetical protein AAF533_30360 [Acidobacteriota bacterium]